jgi:adenine-specific DNA methylase
MSRTADRMIDRWFPVGAVDNACKTPSGSGRVENSVFTWFASRPIAQARAAVFTSLLPMAPDLVEQIEKAILTGDQGAFKTLVDRVLAEYGGKPPIVLDMFSGRGIIPLEAARAGATAVALDLSPVATLAAKLLAEYPCMDWSREAPLPFQSGADTSFQLSAQAERLPNDVAVVLSEIGRRVTTAMASYYPKNENGEFPWGYVWATTMPCDGCGRRFPIVGSFTLRYPYAKTGDPGQSIRLTTRDDQWFANVIDGPPTQEPTFSATTRIDGKKRKGKTARCPFCQHIHPLDSVKVKGEAQQFRDELLVVADVDAKGKHKFREPTAQEMRLGSSVQSKDVYTWPYSALPDEVIPPLNTHTVAASGYGFNTFGQLMCDRQSLSFIKTVDELHKVRSQMIEAGLSETYANVLSSYAAAALCKRMRRSTRGVRVLQHGSKTGSKRNYEQTSDLFSNESKIDFQFDFFEVSPGDGAGSWASVSTSLVQAIRKVARTHQPKPIRALTCSATALPFRDNSIDVVITDPPYRDMIEYADASDLFYVWLKRALFDVHPDLFGPAAQRRDGLQDKNEEIIVRRVQEPNRVKHDLQFYESMLAKAFAEARRVLSPNGHLVVIFGHSDPEAWRRLLGALQSAGFVVTSAWPSRTETANTGVASIKVTVTIGCRVAAKSRPVGMGSEVDREVVEAVTERVRQWDANGLALEDQLMASYGPAMEVFGRYNRVLNPDGSSADLDHYLALARRAVRDAMRLRVDELPIETFDAITRFAIFWLRAKGRSDVPKGEARFFAQADELRLDDLRDRILTESSAGFQIRLEDGRPVTSTSSIFEIVRAMAHAWSTGGTESVAETLSAVNIEPDNNHLRAVVNDLATHLPASDDISKALASIKRSFTTISTLVMNERQTFTQTELFETKE